MAEEEGLALLAIGEDNKIPPPEGGDDLAGFDTTAEEVYKAVKEGDFETFKSSLKALVEMVVYSQM